MSTRSSAPPTVDELVDLVEHVAYEYGMFDWTARQLLERDVMDPRARNVLVETLLLHQRNLVTFLGAEPQGDDVSAGHYADGWSPDREHWHWLQERRESINKRLAHLTAYRVRVDKAADAVPVAEIHRRVRALWGSFLAAADPEWTDALMTAHGSFLAYGTTTLPYDDD